MQYLPTPFPTGSKARTRVNPQSRSNSVLRSPAEFRGGASAQLPFPAPLPVRRTSRGCLREKAGKAEKLSADEIHRIDKMQIGTQHEIRIRALFSLGLGSGMRISEIIGLDLDDVFVAGQVRNRIVLEKRATKSGRNRAVAVSRQAVQPPGVPPAPLPSTGPLFPSEARPSAPMSATNVVILSLKRMFAAAPSRRRHPATRSAGPTQTRPAPTQG